MEAKMWGKRMLDRNGILYPLLVIAAVSVIIFSMFGLAMILGLLPRAESIVAPQELTQPQIRVASNSDKRCHNRGASGVNGGVA